MSNLNPYIHFTYQLFILFIMQFSNFVILHVCSVHCVKCGAPTFSEIGKSLQNLCCHSNRTKFIFLLSYLDFRQHTVAQKLNRKPYFQNNIQMMKTNYSIGVQFLNNVTYFFKLPLIGLVKKMVMCANIERNAMLTYMCLCLHYHQHLYCNLIWFLILSWLFKQVV